MRHAGIAPVRSGGWSRARRMRKRRPGTFPFGILLSDNGSDSMPAYRIHRLRDYLRASFRSAPHVSGVALLKPRDYVPADEISAASPYTAYFEMRDSASPLQVGDVLEAANGEL